MSRVSGRGLPRPCMDPVTSAVLAAQHSVLEQWQCSVPGQCSVPLFGHDWNGASRVRSLNGQACLSNVVCSPSNVVCSHVVWYPRGGFKKRSIASVDEFSFKVYSIFYPLILLSVG